jgi:hypothetical protein
LLAWTQWFAFAGPRTTTAVGVALLLAGVAAPPVFLLASRPFPAYLDAGFVALTLLVVLAVAVMVRARSRMASALGWGVGSVAATASIVVYLASRTVGLPGLAEAVGRWDRPLGTAATALAAAYLALHASLLVGVTVAVPDRRRWHD